MKKKLSRHVDPLAFNISDQDFYLEICNLVEFYYAHSPTYRSWLLFYYDVKSRHELLRMLSLGSLEAIPYLPASAFKLCDLNVVSSKNIIKTLQSSGTSTGVPSKIFLDKKTSEIIAERLRLDTTRAIGSERRPLFIIDEEAVFKNRRSFAARGAAIAGLLKFGKPIRFLLKNNNIDPLALDELWSRQGENILLIGNTINVWKHLRPVLQERKYDLSHATLVHGGGWKGFQSSSVDNCSFKHELGSLANLGKSINFFGMVEQLGAVSYECSEGNFHVPSCCRYLMRSTATGLPVKDGEIGFLQVNSLLPSSYPGASVITDDLGSMMNEHSCLCGSKLPIFTYSGRIQTAEVRGCGSVNG